MEEKIENIKDFYSRWEIKLDDEQGWQIFRKRVTNALGVFEFSLNTNEAETDFFDYIGEIHEKEILPGFRNPFGKTSETKIYSHFLNENRRVEFIMLIEAIFMVSTFKEEQKEIFYQKVKDAINISRIQIEIIKNNNQIITYQKGNEFFDKHLVYDVLDWLSQYPSVHEKYQLALSQVGQNGNERVVLDNLRFAVEQLLKTILKNNKSIEKQKPEILKYLKEFGVSIEIRNLFFSVLNFYENYQNNNVKHGENIGGYDVEFMLYQTGIMINYILKNSKTTPQK